MNFQTSDGQKVASTSCYETSAQLTNSDIRYRRNMKCSHWRQVAQLSQRDRSAGFFYPMLKTARSYLYSCGQNAGMWRTGGRTDRQNRSGYYSGLHCEQFMRCGSGSKWRSFWDAMCDHLMMFTASLCATDWSVTYYFNQDSINVTVALNKLCASFRYMIGTVVVLSSWLETCLDCVLDWWKKASMVLRMMLPRQWRQLRIHSNNSE